MSIETRFNIPLVAGLTLREKQSQQNYRPIIAAHKWFARHPGTLFRALALRDETGKDYDVIACIAGRGFKVRREDMRRLLQATKGKVFTLTMMHLLIDHTRIREHRVR